MRCWYRARSCTRIGAGPFIGGPSVVHRSIAARSSRVVPASAAASPAGPCGIGWFGPNVDPDRGAAAGDAAVADGEDGLRPVGRGGAAGPRDPPPHAPLASETDRESTR